MSVPFQQYLTRVAVFESVKSDITVKNAIFTAFYGIELYPMVTASLESLHECVSVPCQHYQTRVAVSKSVKSDITVKNAILTAVYGI